MSLPPSPSPRPAEAPFAPTAGASTDLEHYLEALSPDERAEVDAMAGHDLAVLHDAEAQAVAADVANDVHTLVAYSIVHGDVEGLEALRQRLGLASLDAALRVARARAPR
jgi:hypothetical protein